MNQTQTTPILTDEERWQATLARDARYDGVFVLAVRSTRIYCRPSCPARKPHRENVTFYADNASAEGAGYRPCKRCTPDTLAADAALVSEICRLIESRLDEPLTLAALAEATHYSPYHLQRVFKRVMGVSPRQYAEAARVGALKAHLQAGHSVTDAMGAAGIDSSSTLYNKPAPPLGMKPSVYRRGGVGMALRYTITDSPLGRLLVAATERGVSAVYLGDDDAVLEAALAQEFPAAALCRDDVEFGAWVGEILGYLRGETLHPDVPLDVQATAFQGRVWHALRQIPPGETRSYGEIARALGNPKAMRAVAGACAHNNTALLIPCHRVVREDGGLGGYRWGIERKQALLDMEQRLAREKA
jgi:AraC family transcriptional regulator of adaptative response/methylated-DNA-[protein]-cysteine methyltransferase